MTELGHLYAPIAAGMPADAVLSKTGSLLYTSGTDGKLRVYDAASRTLLTTWNVGVQLGGMDLSPDGSFLLVTEHSYRTDSTERVYRVDTGTGAVTSYTLSVNDYSDSFYDVAILNDGTALLTQDAYSAFLPLYKLDLATGQFTASSDLYSQRGALIASRDASLATFAPSDNSFAPFYLYKAGQGITKGHSNYADGVQGYNIGIEAVSLAGNLIVQQTLGGGLYVYDASLNYKFAITGHTELTTNIAGMTFDVTGQNLYILSNDYDVIYQVSTATWETVRSFSVGTDVGQSNIGGFGNRLQLTPDGRDFIVITAQGVQLIENDGLANHFTGTAAADDLAGGAGDDILAGAAGNDTLDGGSGADTLDGGTGIDTVDYSLETGGGNVFVNLRPTEIYGASVAFGPNRGLDTYGSYDSLLNIENVKTGGGNDTVYGDDGANRIEAGAGVDYLNGGGGNDYLDAGAGTDYLDGGAGADTMVGGTGNDSFVVDDAGDVVIENAGEGTDEIQTTLASFTLTAPNVENLTGLASTGQTLTGNALANVITGGTGGDIIFGGGGDDQLFGGVGNDRLDGGAGSDTVGGGVGTDTLVVDYSAATQRVFSSVLPSADIYGGWQGLVSNNTDNDHRVSFSSIERFDVTTGSGGDTIVTRDGDDVIRLNGGDDFADVGSGTDWADGGSGVDGISADLSDATGAIVWNLQANSFSGGSDTFLNFEYFGTITTGGGNDVLTTAAGGRDETINSGAGDDRVTVVDGADTVNMGAGTDTLVVAYGGTAFQVYMSDGPNYNGTGTWEGQIYRTGDAAKVTYTGVERFDITTGSGADAIVTKTGDDLVHTNGGNDVVDVGGGTDFADGGDGIDGISADLSDATGAIVWNLQTNSFSGGPDTFLNFEYLGSILTGDGNDVITTGAGHHDERVDALGGDDTITVVDGNDTANGMGGADLLVVDYSATSDVTTSTALTASGAGGYDGRYSNVGDNSSVVFYSIERFIVTTGSGNDVIATGGGDDIVSSGAGNDTLSGNDGNDLLDGGSGNNAVYGGEGDDRLKLSGAGVSTAAGGNGSDRLTIDWSDAATAIVSTSPAGTTMDGYAGSIGDGGSRSVDFTGIESFDITTGSGNDVVRTGGHDDAVHLGAGDDLVYLGSGDPGFSIGSGNDTADGGSGTDGISVDLSAAAAPVVWNLNTNSYSGPLGSFTNFEYFSLLIVGSGNDRITTSTQALDDLIGAGAGADIITVYAGHDAVNGGLDSDMLVVDYSAATDAVTVSGLQTGSGGGAGWQGVVSDGGSRGVFFDNIERLDITTGSGDDVVSGAGGADTIRTGLGADALAGGDGNDLLDGGAGADHMAGGSGNDVYYVDNAGDVVTENGGEGDSDEVRTSLTGYVLSANVEKLTWTGAGAGDLRGNAADNILSGGGAGDFFRLQDGGNDSASGGGGNDAFYFGSAYTSADSVDGGSGSDQVALQGDYSGGVILGTLAGVETLVAMTGTDTRFGADGTSLYSYSIISPDATVAAGTQLMVNASTLLAGENLTFDGSAETNGSFFIYGGKGVDTLTGGSGADVFFFAEDGRFAATDHIDGGAGADVMVLRGNYSLVLSGTSLVNVETVVLNSGSDARFYSAGTSFSYDVTTADDTVAAGQTMTFNGGQLSASETLHFDGSLETNGNFRLFGGSANDVIKGGAGNDLIYGGLGADQLTGGSGADVFRYQGAAESSSTHFDTITGFTYGTDHIDLPFTVSGFADHQANGQVDFATFDADVARLVDGDLNPFGAIELTTFGGDVGNRFFLVVDADGDGAYHANLDYVIELPNVVVPPVPDIFV